MKPDLVLEVAIAPAAALTRVSGAINRRRQRALGVFKTQNEYVGRVDSESFEIWERQQRAVHARGQVEGRLGGSRIELSLGVPRRTRVLIVVFFAVYTLLAAGISLRSPEDIVTAEELVVSVGGAALLIVIFVASAHRQRADLRAFVERLFSDLPRI